MLQACCLHLATHRVTGRLHSVANSRVSTLVNTGTADPACKAALLFLKAFWTSQREFSTPSSVTSRPCMECRRHRRGAGAPQRADQPKGARPHGHPEHRRWAGASQGADQPAGSRRLRHPGHQCGCRRTAEHVAALDNHREVVPSPPSADPRDHVPIWRHTSCRWCSPHSWHAAPRQSLLLVASGTAYRRSYT